MSPNAIGKTLAVLILVVVLVPLALLSWKEPVKVGLPFAVFVVSGVVTLAINQRNARRQQDGASRRDDRPRDRRR